MTQITTTLYQQLAEDYADVWDQLQLIDDSATLALNHVVDVSTVTYIPGNANAALEIELALLGPCNNAASAMTSVSLSTSPLLGAVRAMNGHVINNTTGTTTAKVKLDTWINENMIGLWPYGTANGWKQLSIDAGYDTDDWNVDPNFEDTVNPSYEHIH